MHDFDEVLNEQLEALPDTNVQSKLDLVNEIMRELESAKDRVSELEMELRHAMEEYNIELAKALRQKIPQLNVNLADGRCSASYKSTSLSCRPDLNSKSWVFEPDQHGRRFSRNNGPVLGLNGSVDPLADAIVAYFQRYKSLR